jgi:hypothetical protein
LKAAPVNRRLADVSHTGIITPSAHERKAEHISKLYLAAMRSPTHKFVGWDERKS